MMKCMKKLIPLIILLIPATAKADPQTCMAEAMYFEARSQGVLGMLAIGVVIRNRVKHHGYPSTVCKVIKQGRLSDGQLRLNQCQFSYFCDGKPEIPTDPEAWTTARSLAKIVLDSHLMLQGLENATHYHATTVHPPWAERFRPCKQIGGHIFYASR
jgi:spore germination cell wall hydrolase CwlJ-like protein